MGKILRSYGMYRTVVKVFVHNNNVKKENIITSMTLSKYMYEVYYIQLYTQVIFLNLTFCYVQSSTNM